MNDLPDLLTLNDLVKPLLRDPQVFAASGSGLRLRTYQEQVARAIVDSVIHARGLTFVVMFPRQSGKNELQAQLEAYLLTLYSQYDAEIVKVSPTWKPQSLNAMRRLERVLTRNTLANLLWQKEQGYIYRVGSARIYFLSGEPSANVVGATASTLLECDEAQDVLASKWDKEMSPMAASTNATRVFWGTAWTAQTLLAREKRTALELERQDGIRRVFQIGADEVRAVAPAYGRFVDTEIARLGRSHPFVRTQFFSEEIDAEGGLFPPARLALLRGDHPRLAAPGQPWVTPATPAAPASPARLAGLGGPYSFLIDVAGEDEAAPDVSGGPPGARDATALTIVAVDLTSLADDLLRAPTYRIVDRRVWTGARHTYLYAQIRGLAETWGPRWLAIDATGVGAGLASFLDKCFPGRVLPFVFSQASKSQLGWDLLAVIETGRLRDWALTPGVRDEAALFLEQCRACQMEILPGPERRMRWGVPDGARSPLDGQPLHDDLLLSAALVALLDDKPWGQARSAIVAGHDPLSGVREAY